MKATQNLNFLHANTKHNTSLMESKKGVCSSPSSHHTPTMRSLYYIAVFVLCTSRSVASSTSKSSKIEALQKQTNYRTYPRRTQDEAAVLEWGHSAIISALDASVAEFGPQTSQAALLEVEAPIIFASPLHGGDIVQPLDNADDVHGNVCVMTNTNKQTTGVEMAKIAQLSGAAALIVVNMDDQHPEDIYRLPALDDPAAQDIQIPVVMISLNSANVLTTATVTPNMKKRDIVNNGMPERIRLYAGADRPFFEDVQAAGPTVYLIHNLLTTDECDALVRAAAPRLAPITKRADALQMTHGSDVYAHTDSVMLWRGMVLSPAHKAVEERIEQVTGFPTTHFSDFVVDRIHPGGYWNPHRDTVRRSDVPMATLTIFLTVHADESGGEIVYPATTGSTQPIQVRPTKGLAVVHHSTDENYNIQMNAVRALLPTSSTMYVARKYIYANPIGTARRFVLPLAALPFGGKLPGFLLSFYEFMASGDDEVQGAALFDNVCLFLPLLLILVAAQYGCVHVDRHAAYGFEDKMQDPNSFFSITDSTLYKRK
jgi:hypothetical protein